VLDGIDLTVEAGECLAVLGPNGAGKTSLLKAVAGRLRLDAGLVRIGGETPQAARRQGACGVVPQDVALFADLTVTENLQLFGRLAGVAQAHVASTVANALRWADLADRARSLVRTLSGGMRRRVNLVAGLLHDPRLLLLDEPTVGVDLDARARLHELLRARCQAGMAALAVTHDAEEARSICDRVAVMAAGRIVACDAPDALIARCFPAGAELAVTLAAEPDAKQAAMLREAGVAPKSGRHWSGPSARLDDLARTAVRLADARIAITELRLQPPTLAGAVARLLEGR
jgi:ABC-2 type transport system ATP-binding protein